MLSVRVKCRKTCLQLNLRYNVLEFELDKCIFFF